MTTAKNVQLRTFVGSCVAICLFDTDSKTAAMAHVMLPERPENKHYEKNEEGKYADVAIEMMLSSMIRTGVDHDNIRAKIAGGATIYPREFECTMLDIGTRNTIAVKQILKTNQIPLIAEDTGKNFGRLIRFDLGSGKMTITSKMNKSERII